MITSFKKDLRFFNRSNLCKDSRPTTGRLKNQQRLHKQQPLHNSNQEVRNYQDLYTG